MHKFALQWLILVSTHSILCLSTSSKRYKQEYCKLPNKSLYYLNWVATRINCQLDYYTNLCSKLKQPIPRRIYLWCRKLLFLEYILQAGYNLCRRLTQLLLANDGLVGQILPRHIWGWFVHVWSVIHCWFLLWFYVCLIISCAHGM